MKIKHYAGYGTVEATKVSERKLDGERFIRIKVKGNHEYGIHLDDIYEIAHWLLPKFSKEFKDGQKSYWDIKFMQLTDGYEKDDKGQTVDTCEYAIVYEV